MIIFVMLRRVVGPDNGRNVQVYMECRNRYVEMLDDPEVFRNQQESRRLPLTWTAEQEEYLVSTRSQPNPPTFKNIAFTLNHKIMTQHQENPRPYTGICYILVIGTLYRYI